MNDRVYEELHHDSFSDLLVTLAGGTPSDVIRAILGLGMEGPDREIVEAVAFSSTWAAEGNVRRAGVLALAHSARRFGEANMPAIEALCLRLQHDPGLSGALSDMIDDIASFVDPSFEPFAHEAK